MATYVVSEFINKNINSTGLYWEKITDHIASERSDIFAISPRVYLPKHNRSSAIFISFKTFLKSENTGFFRFLWQIEISLRFVFRLISLVKKDDTVFIGTNPQLLIFFIPLIKIFKKIKICMLCHDIFPENIAASRLLKKNSLLLKILVNISNFMYSKVDKVIVIGRDMLEVVSLKLKNYSGTEVKYIPNSLSIKDVSNVVQYSKENSIDLSFQYFGNFGRVHGIPTLLKCIDRLNSEGCNAKFIFSGTGFYKKMIKDYSKYCNIHLNDPVPFNKSDKGFQHNSISLVTLDHDMYGLAVPSKAYSCMANGRKFIYLGPKNSELHRLILENKNLGWFADINNESECIRVFKTIIDGNFSPFHNQKSYLEKELDENVILPQIMNMLFAADQ